MAQGKRSQQMQRQREGGWNSEKRVAVLSEQLPLELKQELGRAVEAP
jgi:hypothetical protein